MIVIVLCMVILLSMGIYESRANEKRIQSMEVRVNVNGIRGKSTVTRLITSVIAEAGYKTLGKTTGTEARVIYPDTNEEEPIKRRKEGANISEQLRIIKKAHRYGAEALVCECMAVNPDYQSVFQRKMLKANIGVIVNVLEDHLDVMGPTLDEIAEAFTETIPYNGSLVTVPGPYAEFFKKVAAERNTKVFLADNSRITEEYLSRFSYLVFPDNASLALAVGEAIGIDEETALRGMLKANPDPGALRITNINIEEGNGFFVNGFAANDAASTLKIWERVKDLGYSTDNAIVVINCRDDRVDRTEQFAVDVLPYIEAKAVVAIGKSTSPVSKAYKKGSIPCEQYLDLENLSTEKVMEQLMPLMKHSIIFGVGNIHGAGEPFVEALLELELYREQEVNMEQELNLEQLKIGQEPKLVWDINLGQELNMVQDLFIEQEMHIAAGLEMDTQMVASRKLDLDRKIEKDTMLDMESEAEDIQIKMNGEITCSEQIYT